MKRPFEDLRALPAVTLTLTMICFGLTGTSWAGSISAWGRNDRHQCDVPPGGDFATVAGAWDFSLAVKADGSLARWGAGPGWYWDTDAGLCGIRQADAHILSDPPTGDNFVAVAGGYTHCVALMADGSLAAWGTNSSHQCDVAEGNDFVAIGCGNYYGVALRSDGSLTAWGEIDAVPGGNDFVAVAAGAFHVLALRADGSLAATGSNDFGQCDPPAGNDFVEIAAGVGATHGLALRADGSLAAWGRNIEGQCDVPPGNNFTAIAAAGDFSMALRKDGSLVAWGANDHGQCDVPDGNLFTTITCGTSHAMAIEVPEPATFWLLASAGALAGIVLRRRTARGRPG